MSQHDTSPVLQVGEITCRVLSDGAAAYPKEVLFRDVEDEVLLRELGGRLDDDGTVQSAYDCVLLETPTATVLVDAGMGRLAEAAGAPAGHLGTSLTRAGYSPEDVDVVVLTHAHPDHIGGLVTDDEPTFPNARHVLSAVEWDTWTDPSSLNRLPEFLAAPARAILPVLARHDCVDSVDLSSSGTGPTEAEVVTGVHLRAAPGHTPGHCVLSVSGGGSTLTLLADAVVDELQFRHLEWVCAFDHVADQTVRTRKRLLAEAAETGSDLFAYHVGGGFGRVDAAEDGFAWQVTRPV
jgi:glyoxylase-like metal-dependent hydrolase (beta-lactamase superfamily II)